MTDFSSKIKWKRILLIFFALAFIPFPTELVPEWKVQIVDEQNQPLPNVKTEQSWKSYTFFFVEDYEEKCTDSNGVVIYPKRFLWAGALSRIVSPIFADIMTLAHGSTGTNASVRVFDRHYISDDYYWREKEKLYSRERSELPTKVVAQNSNVVSAKSCSE
jgi:hypothetical protein